MKAKAALILVPVIALVALVVGVYWVVLRPSPNGSTVAGNTAKGPQAPDLGGRGKPIVAANDLPETPDNTSTDDGAETDGGEDGSEPEPEPANSAREIDIWLNSLAMATRAGERKGMAISHELLASARPHTLVDERVRAALDGEQNAWVRIQYFLAFHEAEPRFDWAMHVYDTRTAKFMGTDDLYAGGEVEELEQIARELFTKLISSWQADGTGDFRVMALLRNVLDVEKPEWLLNQAVNCVVCPIIEEELAGLAQSLLQDLRAFLLRRTAGRELREPAFVAYMLTFEPRDLIFAELELEAWWDYAAVLALFFELHQKPKEDIELRVRSIGSLGWLDDLADSPKLPQLLNQLLQGSMTVDEKRLLIKRIAERDVSSGRAMIEAGLARKDANYGDYLAAFGYLAETAEELQRLTTAADEPEIASAQGAIEGLRQSALPQADVELRKVLETGTNLGVKGQALGALLSRAKDKDALLEEYLDENKDASLRAVAVQHVPETSLERLQRIAEEDASPTVRLAALNRVGAISPRDEMQRKELYGWFIKIKDRDNSGVIRAAARKYAEGLEQSQG